MIAPLLIQFPAHAGTVPPLGVPVQGTDITKLSIPMSVLLDAFPTALNLTIVVAEVEGNT